MTAKRFSCSIQDTDTMRQYVLRLHDIDLSIITGCQLLTETMFASSVNFLESKLNDLVDHNLLQVIYPYVGKFADDGDSDSMRQFLNNLYVGKTESGICVILPKTKLAPQLTITEQNDTYVVAETVLKETDQPIVIADFDNQKITVQGIVTITTKHTFDKWYKCYEFINTTVRTSTESM